MKILITGLNGFIGKSLKNLLSEKYQVLSLVRDKNNNNKYNNNKYNNIFNIIGDLSNPDEWGEKVVNFAPDYCIHMAWEGLPDYSPEKCKTNLNQNLLFLDFLCKVKVPNIILTGSCYEYGDYDGRLEENLSPQNPSIFGLTKIAIFDYFESLCKANELNFKWARIFFSYGPNQRNVSLIPSIWKNLKLNKKNSIKTPFLSNDFIYVDDVANGILNLLDNKSPSGIYNIGSGKLTSVGYIANLIHSYYKKDLPYPDIDTINLKGFYSDNRKIENLTSWEPKISIEDGVIKTLKYLDKKYG